MSIALDLPPVIEQDVRYCANARGISFAQFVFELVEREAARIRAERTNRVKPNVPAFVPNVPIGSSRMLATSLATD